MRYVLDASAALCWVLPRPNSGKALHLRTDFQNAIHELIAPSVFPGEVASCKGEVIHVHYDDGDEETTSVRLVRWVRRVRLARQVRRV